MIQASGRPQPGKGASLLAVICREESNSGTVHQPEFWMEGKVIDVASIGRKGVITAVVAGLILAAVSLSDGREVTLSRMCIFDDQVQGGVTIQVTDSQATASFDIGRGGSYIRSGTVSLLDGERNIVSTPITTNGEEEPSSATATLENGSYNLIAMATATTDRGDHVCSTDVLTTQID